MRQTTATVDRCPACGCRTGRWRDYFCPDCGQHHDGLYCSEASDPRPRSRREIAHEYRIVGMDAEANRLGAVPDVSTPSSRPHPRPRPPR